MEDLLPTETGAEIAGTIQQSAVDFVRAEFSKTNPAIESCPEPWNLVSKTEEGERRYVVRVLSAGDEAAAVSFTAIALDQLKESGVDTTLVIVQPNEAENSAAEFRMIQTVEHWTPNLSVMKPVTWSLPIPVQMQPADAPSVTSAKP